MEQGSRLGSYHLLQAVGRGGMGEVWRARHVGTGVDVAIKLITEARAAERYSQASFRNELRAVAALDHPGIVMVLDEGVVDRAAVDSSGGRLVEGSPYLVLEYAGAGTLLDAKQRVMSWPELRAVLLSLLDALAHAHARGVVHRDLKPGNVLLCGLDHARPGLKLSDFGLAHIEEDADRRGSEERVRGTLHYMAPEQCLGLWRDQGPWTDLYALGIMAYELGSGRLPFAGRAGDSLLQAHIQRRPPAFPIRRGLPAGLGGWLQRMLAKDPWHRYRCAADAAWALLKLGEPSDSAPGGWVFPELASALGLSDVAVLEPREGLDDPSHSGSDRQLSATEAALPTAVEVPPMPRSWRLPGAPMPWFRLMGAGLGLLGVRSIPMVGRVVERDQLWSALAAVGREGHTQVILLRGPNGAGMSRLALWLRRRAVELGAANGVQVDHQHDVPGVEALRRAMSGALTCMQLGPQEVERRVTAFVEGLGGGDEADIATLSEFIVGAAGAVQGSELHALLRRTLGRVARRRPVVLSLDDVQWSAEALDFIDYLVRPGQRDGLPCLVVATVRDDALGAPGTAVSQRIERLLQRDGVREIELGPLSRRERQELVKGRLGLEDTLAVQVERRCGGNPLFAVQLVTDWVRQGVLLPGERGWTLRRGANAELPDSLHSAWEPRVRSMLDGLSVRAEGYLERAAVLGERIDELEWWDACDVDLAPEIRLLDAQGALIRSELVECLLEARLASSTATGWRFSHPALRESILRRSREHGRSVAHHVAAAQMLEGRGTERAQGYAERLGRHLQAAGRPEAALGPLLEAAEAWRAASGHLEALELVVLCEALADELGLQPDNRRRGTLLWLRAHCHYHRGEYADAMAWLERSARFERGQGTDEQLASVYLDGVSMAWMAGDVGQVVRLMTEVRTLVGDRDGGLVGLRRAIEEARFSAEADEFDAAERWGGRAVALAERLDNRPMLGVALRSLGRIVMHRGDLARAQGLFLDARAVQEEHAGLKEVADTVNHLGECARRQGAIGRAEAFYRESIALYDRGGVAAKAHLPRLNLAIIYGQTERDVEAVGPLTEALEMAEGQGNTNFALVARVMLLPVCAAMGDWAGWALQLDRIRGSRSSFVVLEPELVTSARRGADMAAHSGREREARAALELCLWMCERLADDEGYRASERALAELRR